MASGVSRSKCPFFGTEIRLWTSKLGVFATSDYREQGWATVLFPTIEAIEEILGRRAPLLASLPAAAPVMTCPFTGKAIAIVPAGEGKFEARVEGLWMSRPLVGERRVEYFVSTRNGIPPLFQRALVVEVRERTEPPPEPELPKVEGEGNVREVIERTVAEATGVRPTVVVPGKPEPEGRRLRGRRADKRPGDLPGLSSQGR